MKWYWILIIVLAVIAVGVIIGLAVKKSKKASSPAEALVKDIEKPATDVTVSTGNGVEVVKKDNADGTKTVAVSRVAA